MMHQRLQTIVAVLFACISTISADVKLTYPASGATVTGGAMTLQWQDSGANPALVAIAAADIVLCTGTNAAPQLLYTIAGSVPLGSEASLAVTIPLTIGASGQYFLKFISTTGAGNVVTTYSDRFTLIGMTGTVVANTGLAVTGPAGITPAAASTETAAATAKPVAATATNRAVSVNLAAYASQTGLTHTGPPQGRPGTAITADAQTAQPLWPTSAYTIYTTLAPIPVAVTTLTASPAYTWTTLVNGAAAATFTGN